MANSQASELQNGFQHTFQSPLKNLITIDIEEKLGTAKAEFDNSFASSADRQKFNFM